jgi:replicative DNA helicase
MVEDSTTPDYPFANGDAWEPEFFASPADAASAVSTAGLSFLPIRLDGSKRPESQLLPFEKFNEDTAKFEPTWKPLESRLPTEDERRRWFDRERPPGIAVIHGKVSGAAEMIDFDEEAEDIFPKWCELVHAEVPDLLAKLNVIRTPRPGFAIRYRCQEIVIPGNDKLAQDPRKEKKKQTLIETRGEGGYGLIPGCPPECHETGRPYVHVGGPGLTNLQSITAAEREILFRCARSFDRKEANAETNHADQNGKARNPFTKTAWGYDDSDLRPGDDFDRRGPDWPTILEPHDWTKARQCNDVIYWRRPEKDGPGWSATTGYCTGKNGEPLLRLFSSNAHPFEDGKTYGKFRAYALLNHNGDMSAAARELAKQGYGSQKMNGAKSNNNNQPPKAEPEPEKTGYSFNAIPAKEFARAQYTLEWLIQSTLVRGMPVIVGGPRKALKTTFLVDMALALGSATPFLGKLRVYHRVRTCILSGESGPAALQEIALRICAAKGIDLADTDTHWGFDLPQLAEPGDLLELQAGLKANKIEAAIIDPLYISLLSGRAAKGMEASNLFDMGPLLRAVAQTCLSVGCTPILAHHSVKRLDKDAVFEPLELESLAFSGIQEFARQWLLINRRLPFDPEAPGSHRLWLSVGGSIGVAKLYAVDVEEGELKDDFSGRKWEATVRGAREAINERCEGESRQKDEKKEREKKSDGTKLLNAIDSLIRLNKATKDGIVKRSEAQHQAGLSDARMDRAANDLIGDGIIEAKDFTIKTGRNHKVSRTVEGLRRKPRPEDHQPHMQDPPSKRKGKKRKAKEPTERSERSEQQRQDTPFAATDCPDFPPIGGSLDSVSQSEEQNENRD